MSRFAQIWLISLALKLVLAAWIPLSADEAYYWVWSKHFQLSYYDHPPMVAQLMALGDLLPSWGQMLRWPAVLLAHLSLLIWREILRPHLTETQLTAWLLLILALPLLGPGSMIVTPDLPLLFFWSLTLWLFQLWSAQPSSKRITWALGLSLGLGFMSKYTFVLIFPILLFWSLRTDRLRPFLSQAPKFALAAFLASWPVWLWNYQNEFSSFRFQLHHGLGRPKWKPSWTVEYIGAQFALYLPLGFFLIRSRLNSVLKFAALFPILFFLVSTARGYAEANWPITAGAPLVATALAHPRFGSRLQIWTMALWFSLLAVVLTSLLFFSQSPWIRGTKLSVLSQFADLRHLVHERDPLFVRSYQMAAKLSYETKTQVYKLKGMNRVDFYDFRVESSPHTKMFYLLKEPDEAVPPPWDKWSIAPIDSVDGGYQLLEIKAE